MYHWTYYSMLLDACHARGLTHTATRWGDMLVDAMLAEGL